MRKNRSETTVLTYCAALTFTHRLMYAQALLVKCWGYYLRRTYSLLDVSLLLLTTIFTSSLHKVFCKKDVLKNFAKFTGKHLLQSLFFNKVAGLRPATLLKKTHAQAFSCEFCEVFKNTFL